MKTSHYEANGVGGNISSKLGGVNRSEPRSLQELFEEPGPGFSDEMKKYLEEEVKKQVEQSLTQQEAEHKMCMRERRAGVLATHAVTGVFATWVVVGLAMLGRSCINFDKSPKFKV